MRTLAATHVQGKNQNVAPPGGNLQRTCACGKPMQVGDECAACRKKRLALQRKSSGQQEDPATAPPIVHEVLRSPGQPLDPPTRTFMESRFSHDFSGVRVRPSLPQIMPSRLKIEPANDQSEQEADQVANSVLHPKLSALDNGRTAPEYNFSQVRVHTNAKAAKSAQAVNALAYTVDNHIIFGKSQYRPQTKIGQRLLAHELVHTMQQGNSQRLSRACADTLEGIRTPAGDSLITGQALVNLASVPITEGITVSPLAGNFHVKFHVPRALQEAVAGTGFLGRLQATIDISATIRSEGTSAPARSYANNELCVFVTFSRREAGEETEGGWLAEITVLRGGQFVAPLHTGLGTGLSQTTGPLSSTGVARITVDLTDNLTGSAGPFQINSLGDIQATWPQIRDQVRDILAIRIQNVRVPLNLRSQASLTLPLPLPGSGEESAIIPIRLLGDVRLSTQLSSQEGQYRLRLGGAVSGTAAAGTVALELSGRGQLAGPIPSSIRLGDLNQEYLQQILRQSEGGGEITGRLSAFGLPGRVNADFRLQEGRLFGDATLISPVAIGAGRFNYSLSEGLSADLGIFGLTRLVLAPAEERLQGETPRRETGPPRYDLGTSVTGIGVTGVRLTPSTTQILSIGVGPQLVTTPENQSIVGAYGGLNYQILF